LKIVIPPLNKGGPHYGTLYTINTYASQPSVEAREGLQSVVEEERPRGTTTRYTVHLGTLVICEARSAQLAKICTLVIKTNVVICAGRS